MKCYRASLIGNRCSHARHAPGAAGGVRVGWSRVTGETDWNSAFAAHELVVDDGGLFRAMRPATRRRLTAE